MYHANDRGITYGHVYPLLPPEEQGIPELIAAIGLDGVKGYIYARDLDRDFPPSATGREGNAQKGKAPGDPQGVDGLYERADKQCAPGSAEGAADHRGLLRKAGAADRPDHGYSHEGGCTLADNAYQSGEH